MSFADAMRKDGSFTRTENGAVALNTTGDARLDLFGTIGSLRETDEGRIEPPTHALDWNEIAVEITNMICVFISLLYHLSYLAMWHVLLICKDVCAIALIGESWI